MIIEIHGAGFENKGAELMLYTAVSELRHRLPQFVPAIDPTYGSYNLRSSLKLHQVIPPRSHVGTPGFPKRFRRQKLFAAMGGSKFFSHLIGASVSSYGCVNLSEIQGLVDVAGFAYTDQWGTQPTRDFASISEHFSNQGKPVILLPQAFGPFEKKESRSAFKRILDSASLIFARDQQSYKHIQELSPTRNNLFLAPDITLFYPKPFPVKSIDVNDRKYVCIVPNIRMMDQGRDAWGIKYKNLLISTIEELKNKDINVYLVIHDYSGQDLKLAQEICNEARQPTNMIISEKDPFLLKKFIAGSLMVIGSRYHSLVAAFSVGVPTIGLGWSHKYDMLFHDFGCEKYLISPRDDFSKLKISINDLVSEKTNLEIRLSISGKLVDLSRVNQNMWEMVIRILNKLSS